MWVTVWVIDVLDGKLTQRVLSLGNERTGDEVYDLVPKEGNEEVGDPATRGQ